MTPRDAIPRSWLDRIGSGALGIGVDLATTTKGTSNPSGLTVLEEAGGLYIARLVLSWKTADDRITKEILKIVINDLIDAENSPRRLCVDSSNEKFFAGQIRREFSRLLPVDLVAGGELVKHKGEELNSKTLLGNLYANAIEDGQILLPLGDWISDDHRLVHRERGSFETKTGKGGRHGDLFDGGKLALWALVKGGGRVQASGVSTTERKSSKRRRNLRGAFRTRRRHPSNSTA